MANIVANTESIEQECKNLETARNAVDAEKDKLSQLRTQGNMLQGMVNLEGVTAEKYKKIHADFTKAATTTIELMDALIASIRNYAKEHEKTDQSSANTFNNSGGGSTSTSTTTASNKGTLQPPSQINRPILPNPFQKPNPFVPPITSK